jgi:curved DNA-binding protein CbpA
MTPDDPRRILQVDPDATDEQIRAAYLRLVKEHPPDRDPAHFELVRDAYERLRDPRRRAREMLFSGHPAPPLESLLDGVRKRRNFLGPKPWLAVLKDI